jgi:hypothetical protein
MKGGDGALANRRPLLGSAAMPRLASTLRLTSTELNLSS